MSYVHALFEADIEDLNATNDYQPWIDVLNCGMRDAVRDILVNQMDYASLAALRMTCKQEDAEQYTWFQLMPSHARCSWGVVEEVDCTIIRLIRPRSSFYICAMDAGHYELAEWSASRGYDVILNRPMSNTYEKSYACMCFED
jgi:hypothetical protein